MGEIFNDVTRVLGFIGSRCRMTENELFLCAIVTLMLMAFVTIVLFLAAVFT